jgi:multidrug efflux system outer membrane protein
MLLTYEQTIQGAFRDVSNGLIAYRKNREFRIQQEHLLESAQDAARLSEVRFKAGTTDYLEVLTNETNSFSAGSGERTDRSGPALPGLGWRLATIGRSLNCTGLATDS